MSNSLDPDQARHFVGPDLGPNCLQKLSVDDTSKELIKESIIVILWPATSIILQYVGIVGRYHGESFCLFVLMLYVLIKNLEP